MTTSTTARLSTAERQLVVGVCFVAGGFTIVMASYNYILNPMLEGLNASESQTAILRQLPFIAGLLVVFLGGVLGDRLGDRKMLITASILFIVGTALVTVAPVLPVASFGLVLESIAASAGGVIGLGMLSARISDPQNRASAFSIFAIVSPAIYVIVPVLSGYLVGALSWRYATGLWVIAGLCMLWATLRLLPADTGTRGGDELLSPIIAGAVLAAAVQLVNSLTTSGVTSLDTLIRLSVMVGGLLWLAWLFRRPVKRSLSLAALRHGGMLILLAVVLLVPFANLWFYATVGYQYVFGLTVLQTALAMIPSSLTGVAAGIVTRKILQKRGVRVTGVATLIAFAVSLLTLLLIQPDSPLWVPMAVYSIYGFAITATGIPITNAIMNTAAKGEEGSASAFRSAASRVGQSLGVVFTSGLMVAVATPALTSQLSQQGIQNEQSKQIVDSLIDGATSEEVASQYSVPVQQVQSIDTDLAHALVTGLHVVSLAGAVIALICAGFYAYAMRKQEKAQQTATA